MVDSNYESSWHLVPSLNGKWMGKQWKQWETLFSLAPKSLCMVTAAVKLKDACSLEENLCQPRQCIKKVETYFAKKGPSSQCYGFSCSHVQMWELDHKESWALKNWCFWTVVLEKTLESPLDWKEMKPANPKGNQPWTFIGRIYAEAETPVLWPPDSKSWLIRKDPDARKDWRQEEKGTTEDKMVGWHHQFNGHEFEQALGDGEGQGSRACCNPWGCKESDTTKQLNTKNRSFQQPPLWSANSHHHGGKILYQQKKITAH